MHLTHEFTFKHLGVAATRQKTYYDQNLKPRSYNIGDWVWRYYLPTAALKIGAGWTGPYLVVDKISDLTYSVQKSETSPVLNFSVDDLKPYEGTNPPNNWLSEQTTIEENPTDISTAAHEGVTQTLELEHEELSPNEASVDLTPEVDSPDLQSQNISVSQNASDSYGLTQPSGHSSFPNTNMPSAPTQSRQTTGIPIIRSRRERVVKPLQLWSPS